MRNLTVAAGALAAALLIGASMASAATPQQIYRDYADNGHLDGNYSASDLQRAYKDAVVQGYAGPQGNNMKPTVNKGGQQSGQKGGEQGVTTPPAKSTGGLPFTGIDLALITVGGVLLLAFGASLRRFARRTT